MHRIVEGLWHNGSWQNTHDAVICTVIKPTSGRTEQRSIHGLPATQFVGARRNEQGQTQAMRTLLVSGPGDRNYLLSYGARDTLELQRAMVGLAEAEGSFRPLSTAERAAARPWTLRVVPYPSGGFDEMARSSPLMVQAEAQLKLLNSTYAGGAEPRPGQLVKIVR